MGVRPLPEGLQAKTKYKLHSQMKKAMEEQLKGDSQLIPPDYLNEEQVLYFWYIADNLQKAGIIGSIDTFVIAQGAVAIERLSYLEKMGNDNPDMLFNQNFLRCKKQYTADFKEACVNLCLSPSTRAKIANIMVKKQETNPLMDILGEEE